MGTYQARQNNLEENPEKSYSEQKQESTEKAVDLGGEMVLDYFTGGLGSTVKDVAGKVPVVGNVVNNVWDGAVKGISSVASKTPVGDVLKQADDAGVTDFARKAKNTVNIGKGGAAGAAKTAGSDAVKAGSDAVKAGSDATNTASDVANTAKSSNNKNNSNKSKKTSSTDSKSSSKLSNGDVVGAVWDVIPPTMKIKIYIGAGICLIFMMMVFTVFANDDNQNLNLTNSSTMSGTSSSNISGTVDSSMYGGASATMLGSGETLLSRLGQDKLNSINAQIVSDVDSAGRGTGAGVATAAYDFIKLLLDNGINMTYTFGGEHGTVKTGLQGNWGAGNGLDCSSFVSWALYNGGCTNHTQATVSGTQATYGTETTADKLKAGDIIANSEHVMLVIENTGSSIKVAHASSPTNGIIFSENTYDSLSNYSLRDMSSYYQQNCSS